MSNAEQPYYPMRARTGGARVCRVPNRKIPYRVGYNWNKGGRLKELRIRHLARKFLKLWLLKTFGRVLPHEAKSHYSRIVLRRVFSGWKDEWWTSRREWSLTLRADCHYRYHVCNSVFNRWQRFVSLMRERKKKIQHARLSADRRQLRQIWECWEVFIHMRKMKRRMSESALELHRLTALQSAWQLWRTRLQQLQHVHVLEEQAEQQRELALQRRVWIQWRERHTAALCEKKKEWISERYFIQSLKHQTLQRWRCYICNLKTKSEKQAEAQHACRARLLKMFWSKWSSALLRKQMEEERLEAAGRLAAQSTQRRAVQRWKAYVMMCKDEEQRNRAAREHHHHHLLQTGLKGFSLNVVRKKIQRLNINMAVQQQQQTMTRKYWMLWQERLEEAEDRNFHRLTETALSYHSSSLLSGCLQHWRDRSAEQKHMQGLALYADVWFAEHTLPRCFKRWTKFTLQQRSKRQRKHTADIFNRQCCLSWVFYSWWESSEKKKEMMLSERLAILHEERVGLQQAWTLWRWRTQQRILEQEKREASERLYVQRLLHRTVSEWKEASTQIRERRHREQRACHQGDQRCMRWAVERWKQFVQCQKKKKSRLRQIQHFHEVKLIRHTFRAWKRHHLQTCELQAQAEGLYRQTQENMSRHVLCVWRGRAAMLAELKLTEQRAQSHHHRILQLKVFLVWREAAAHAVSKRLQLREAVSRAQRSINEARLLQFLNRWRKVTRAACRERISTEKAQRHHESKLVSKALRSWKKNQSQCRRNKVMKRQGIVLLRLKVYQKYFEVWKAQLQHRQRETAQTERALWHWSLTLQAKVLSGWRMREAEQRRKRQEMARAAEVYRDQLLTEGVKCILTYAAHMNDLTTSLTQHSQEESSRRVHRVVRRCALRWKHAALCKPGKEVKVQLQNKRVTFCLTAETRDQESKEQGADDGALRELLLGRQPRRVPRRCQEQLQSPQRINYQTLSAVGGAKASFKPCQLSSQEAHVATPDRPEDLLLPPSAFMTTGAEETFGKGFGSGFGGRGLGPRFEQAASLYPDNPQRSSSGGSVGSASALTQELLSIQRDMKAFQQDKTQLRAWRALKEVLQSWLQTSGEYERAEKDSVSEELEELDERIAVLSADLLRRKPAMLLHAERIQRLHPTGFRSSSALSGSTGCYVFTDRQGDELNPEDSGVKCGTSTSRFSFCI